MRAAEAEPEAKAGGAVAVAVAVAGAGRSGGTTGAGGPDGPASDEDSAPIKRCTSSIIWFVR